MTMRWAISAGVWARAAALALAWLSTGLLWSAPLQAATRGVALVVGNGAYAQRPLTNTANDARDKAALLREAGFEVMLKTDVEASALKEALAEFEASCAVPATGRRMCNSPTCRQRCSRCQPPSQGHHRERDTGCPGGSQLTTAKPT